MKYEMKSNKFSAVAVMVAALAMVFAMALVSTPMAKAAQSATVQVKYFLTDQYGTEILDSDLQKPEYNWTNTTDGNGAKFQVQSCLSEIKDGVCTEGWATSDESIPNLFSGDWGNGVSAQLTVDSSVSYKFTQTGVGEKADLLGGITPMEGYYVVSFANGKAKVQYFADEKAAATDVEYVEQQPASRIQSWNWWTGTDQNVIINFHNKTNVDSGVPDPNPTPVPAEPAKCIYNEAVSADDVNCVKPTGTNGVKQPTVQLQISTSMLEFSGYTHADGDHSKAKYLVKKCEDGSDQTI
ncbi:MAG: hypothetical protein LBM13_01540, partial [Candidatus Ancillula sp.]|nr:hypothetical protein [Candidatus Ancillula sp.]